MLFGGGIVASLATTLGVDASYQVGATDVLLGVGVWLALSALFARRVRRSDGSWWGPIPSEQYLGRFAAYGGLARHSWERAIRQLPGSDEDG